VLLREGTDTSQGKGQLISNINACMAVVDSIRTTLVRRRGGRSRRRSARQRLRRPFDFVFPLTTHRPIAQGPRGLDKLVHDDKGVTTISNDGATIMKVRDETRSPRGVGTADDARNETRRSANTSPRRSRPVCQPRERKRARAKIASRPFSRKKKTRSFRLRLSD
jgi:T-complex protein 1 subunit eta